MVSWSSITRTTGRSPLFSFSLKVANVCINCITFTPPLCSCSYHFGIPYRKQQFVNIYRSTLIPPSPFDEPEPPHPPTRGRCDLPVARSSEAAFGDGLHLRNASTLVRGPTR